MDQTAQTPSPIPAPQQTPPKPAAHSFDWSRVAVYFLILLFLVSFGFAFYLRQTQNQNLEPAVHPIKVTPVISQTPVATQDAILQLLSHLPSIMGNDSWEPLQKTNYTYISFDPPYTATISGYSIQTNHSATDAAAMLQAVQAFKGFSIDWSKWQDDPNQDAGGPTGNARGFKRIVNGKEQVLIIDYGMDFAQFGPQTQPACPCSYKYHVFYSDPFTPPAVGTVQGKLLFGPTSPQGALCSTPESYIRIGFTDTNGKTYTQEVNGITGEYSVDLPVGTYTISYFRQTTQYSNITGQKGETHPTVTITSGKITSFNGCVDTGMR